MNSNMTRKQKEALAAVFIDQAGNLVEFFAEMTKGNAALAGVTSDQVSRQLSTWLNRLPGDAWDVRLQGYDVPAAEPTVTVVDATQEITPIMEKILRSAVPLNGMITFIPSDTAGAAELDELIDCGFLWGEEGGGALYLDQRGNEWLREHPVQAVEPEIKLTPKQRAALELIRDNPRRVRQHTLYGKVDPIEADMLPLHENTAYPLRQKGLIRTVRLGTGKQVKIYGRIETMDFTAYELTTKGEKALGMYGVEV
jgi:hypothetical protein